MKTIEINGTVLKVKDHYCCPCGSDFDPEEGMDYIAQDDPKLWLYVNVTNKCNAACPFCVSGRKSSEESVDLVKYQEAVKIAAPYVSGVSFTGGEPMLNLLKLHTMIMIADEYVDRNIEFDMVTNGTNLEKTSGGLILNRLSTIHISRHAIDDEENRRLMKWDDAPSWNYIKETVAKFYDPGAVVLNCVLQKGGVENMEDVCAYLDKAIEAGIRNSSFITMIPANTFCTDNYISPMTFPVVSDEQVRLFNETHDSKISIWNRMRDHNYCKCLSGSYENAKGRTRFYFRFPGDKKAPDYCRQLVYTADNDLQAGFGENSTISID